jgi:hypothetical protein
LVLLEKELACQVRHILPTTFPALRAFQELEGGLSHPRPALAKSTVDVYVPSKEVHHQFLPDRTKAQTEHEAARE